MGREISAVKIKALYYADVLTAAPTKTTIKALITAATPINNSHQGTFTYEETDPTINNYKNELTGEIYRSDIEEGETKISFVIGQYDFATKAALHCGEVTADGAWKRAKYVQNFKAIFAITEDDVLIVFPKGQLIGGGKSQDSAIGLSMQAIPQSVSSTIGSEYWFDYQEVSE